MTEECRRWKCARKLIEEVIERSGLEGFLLRDLSVITALSKHWAEMHVVRAMPRHSSVVTAKR